MNVLFLRSLERCSYTVLVVVLCLCVICGGSVRVLVLAGTDVVHAIYYGDYQITICYNAVSGRSHGLYCHLRDAQR